MCIAALVRVFVVLHAPLPCNNNNNNNNIKVVESGAKNIEIAVLRRGSHTEILPLSVVEAAVAEIEKAREADEGGGDAAEEKQADDAED